MPHHRHLHIDPCAHELLQIDGGEQLAGVLRVDQHGHLVANGGTAENLVVAPGVENVVGHGVATRVGQQHEHRVVAPGARQSVNHRVVLGQIVLGLHLHLVGTLLLPLATSHANGQQGKKHPQTPSAHNRRVLISLRKIREKK